MLADAIGIGKGSLYNAFGNKHNLFVACLQRYSDEEYQGVLRQLEDGSTDLRSRIRAVFQAAIDSDRIDSAGCLIVNTAAENDHRDEQTREIVEESLTRMRDAFVAVLRAGVVSGELDRDRDIDALADFLQCTLIGMRVIGRTSGADASKRLINAVVDQI